MQNLWCLRRLNLQCLHLYRRCLVRNLLSLLLGSLLPWFLLLVSLYLEWLLLLRLLYPS